MITNILVKKNLIENTLNIMKIFKILFVITIIFIINHLIDLSIIYVKQKKYIPSFYYKTLFSNEIKIDEFINFNKKNSVLISDNQIPELKILKKLNLPRFVKFTKTDLFYVYFTDTIYIYEL